MLLNASSLNGAALNGSSSHFQYGSATATAGATFTAQGGNKFGGVGAVAVSTAAGVVAAKQHFYGGATAASLATLVTTPYVRKIAAATCVSAATFSATHRPFHVNADFVSAATCTIGARRVQRPSSTLVSSASIAAVRAKRTVQGRVNAIGSVATVYADVKIKLSGASHYIISCASSPSSVATVVFNASAVNVLTNFVAFSAAATVALDDAKVWRKTPAAALMTAAATLSATPAKTTHVTATGSAAAAAGATPTRSTYGAANFATAASVPSVTADRTAWVEAIADSLATVIPIGVRKQRVKSVSFGALADVIPFGIIRRYGVVSAASDGTALFTAEAGLNRLDPDAEIFHRPADERVFYRPADERVFLRAA